MVTRSAADANGGIEHGALLLRLGKAILSERDDLDAARADAIATLGERKTVHACQIVAVFDGINRVADTAGIRTDAAMDEPARVTIKTLGIAAMESA